MLFKMDILDRVASGDVTIAFRRWKRPTVKTGGTLQTPKGLLSILSVQPTPLSSIRLVDAQRAGFSTRQELVDELNRIDGGKIYRVEFKWVGGDKRTTLSRQIPDSNHEYAEVISKLLRKDNSSKTGPWTLETMKLIQANPGVRAANLAETMKMDVPPFKARVRQLKSLGLTHSLAVGYRLSPRGEAVVFRLERTG